MIKHIVMWRFDTEENCAEAKKRLDTLPAKVSQIVEFEAGVDFNRSDAAYDLVLYSVFNTKEDLGIYAKHPDHVEVAQFIGSVATERAVVDYEI